MESPLFDRVVEEIYTALPLTLRDFVKDQSICEQWNEGSEYGFPSLSVSPEVGEWQEGGGQLLSLTSPHFGKFQDVGKTKLYQTCVKVLKLETLSGVRQSRWIVFFGSGSSPKGSWRSLYKLPIEKRTGDLQWRIVHGAIATNRY